jgi:prolipoprotein diacylglyceryltransferase
MDHLHITHIPGLYHIFYLISFTLGVAWISWQARIKGWDAVSVVVVLTWTVVGAVVGSRLIVVPFDRLLESVASFQLPADHGRSLLGGLAGGALALLAASHLLRVSAEVRDTVAVILPLCVAVGRLGCLFAGCCFGAATESGLGLTYGPGAPAYLVQLNHGLIEHGAVASLPVFPVPLIEMIFCAIMLAALLATRGVLKPGNSFYLSLCMYCGLRFFGEYFRYQPAGAGFSNNQIATAIVGIVLLLIFVSIELRKTDPSP